jgi:hypothetical protein
MPGGSSGRKKLKSSRKMSGLVLFLISRRLIGLLPDILEQAGADKTAAHFSVPLLNLISGS